MAVVPDGRADKIVFCESHVPTWTTNATTSAAVTALGTLTTAARAALTAQQNAQDAAKSATNTLNMAVEAMATATSQIISQIRAKALTAGDSVYSLANIPVPATPSPAGLPGTPYKFTATLDGNGALNLAWKCENPAAGTMYQVYRKTTDAGQYGYLGGSGQKKFVDATIPAGSSQVMYQVQAVRSTGAGPWATFVVHFGAGGVMTFSEEVPTMKQAA